MHGAEARDDERTSGSQLTGPVRAGLPCKRPEATTRLQPRLVAQRQRAHCRSALRTGGSAFCAAGAARRADDALMPFLPPLSAVWCARSRARVCPHALRPLTLAPWPLCPDHHLCAAAARRGREHSPSSALACARRAPGQARPRWGIFSVRSSQRRARQQRGSSVDAAGQPIGPRPPPPTSSIPAKAKPTTRAERGLRERAKGEKVSDGLLALGAVLRRVEQRAPPSSSSCSTFGARFGPRQTGWEGSGRPEPAAEQGQLSGLGEVHRLPGRAPAEARAAPARRRHPRQHDLRQVRPAPRASPGHGRPQGGQWPGECLLSPAACSPAAGKTAHVENQGRASPRTTLTGHVLLPRLPGGAGGGGPGAPGRAAGHP